MKLELSEKEIEQMLAAIVLQKDMGKFISDLDYRMECAWKSLEDKDREFILHYLNELRVDINLFKYTHKL